MMGSADWVQLFLIRAFEFSTFSLRGFNNGETEGMETIIQKKHFRKQPECSRPQKKHQIPKIISSHHIGPKDEIILASQRGP